MLDDLQQGARFYGRIPLRQVPALHYQIKQLAACNGTGLLNSAVGCTSCANLRSFTEWNQLAHCDKTVGLLDNYLHPPLLKRTASNLNITVAAGHSQNTWLSRSLGDTRPSAQIPRDTRLSRSPLQPSAAVGWQEAAVYPFRALH